MLTWIKGRQTSWLFVVFFVKLASVLAYLLTCSASSTQPGLELTKQMEPPRFLKPVSGLDVPEGGQAVFEVVVSGQPLPEVTWFHEGRPIQHGPDFQVGHRFILQQFLCRTVILSTLYLLLSTMFWPGMDCRRNFKFLGNIHLPRMYIVSHFRAVRTKISGLWPGEFLNRRQFDNKSAANMLTVGFNSVTSFAF